VADEYGGVSGLATLEDILEDLFGDLYEQHGIKENLWQRIDEKTLVVSGSMLMDDFLTLFDIDLPRGDFDTAGGFVFHLFGKLPAKGEAVSFGGYTFRVEMMGKARILTIRVERDEVREDE
jgi:magnesium and cobalt transporter